jgi:hypothetical protein
LLPELLVVAARPGAGLRRGGRGERCGKESQSQSRLHGFSGRWIRRNARISIARASPDRLIWVNPARAAGS